MKIIQEFKEFAVRGNVIDMAVGLRVRPEEEISGLDIEEHGLAAYPDFETIYNPLMR